MSLNLSLSKLGTSQAPLLTSPRAHVSQVGLMSPRVHASQKSLFHETSLKRDYSRDITFGKSRSNVREIALKEQSTADFNLLRYSSNEGSGSAPIPDHGDPKVQAGIDAYHAQYKERNHGREPTGLQRATEDFRFLVLRGNMIGPNERYINFMELLVSQAVSPSDGGPRGRVGLTLDQFDFYQHFSARALVEQDRQKTEPGYTFVHYLEQHTMGSRSGPKHDGLHHASVTSLEIGSLLEGRYNGSFREGRYRGVFPKAKNRNTGQPYEQVPVRFFDANGNRIDDEKVRELYARAADACSDPENMDHLASTGRFSPTAKAAVDALQQFAHGNASMLAPAEKWDVNMPERQAARGHFGLVPEARWSPNPEE